MTQPSLNLRGAVDLSALAAQKEAKARAAEATANAPAGLIVDVTEATFRAEVLDRSMQVPVIIDLWATWCGPCKTLSPILESLIASYAGRLVLAKIDVDANQGIAQALQVQSIPSVLAAIGGRLMPLFQGAYPEPQVRQYLDEVIAVAEQAGISGGVAGAEAPAGEPVEADEPPLDPRFAAAFDAIEEGDWDAAEAAYQRVLSDTPSDADAKAGLALVGLYKRTDGVDPVAAIAAADANPGDAAAAELAADLDALQGLWAEAFARLTAAVRITSGDDRERIRKRLLELFDIAGDDPAVAPARIALSNALF